MPNYSFICQKCENKFLIWATFEEYDKKDPKKFKCPKCGSRRIEQMIGNIFFIKTNKDIRCSCSD